MTNTEILDVLNDCITVIDFLTLQAIEEKDDVKKEIANKAYRSLSDVFCFFGYCDCNGFSAFKEKAEIIAWVEI